MALEPAGSCAVQVRLTTHGQATGIGVVAPLLFGRARSEAEGQRLAFLVRSTLPAEIVLEPITQRERLSERLTASTGESVPEIIEIRRRVEDIGLLPGVALDDARLEPALLSWDADRTGLRHAATVLAQHPTAASIVLHMEPSRPSSEVMFHIDGVVRAVATDADIAANPLRSQVGREYRQRLRDLPRASLHVRVAVISPDRIVPGLAESIGVALTVQEAFALVRAESERESVLAQELADTLQARWWGGSGDDILDELSRLATTPEAASIVRFPTPARGGTVGLPSVPLPTLPRSAQPEVDATTRGVDLGQALGGGRAALSLVELNQHLLVSGLPGFGKTLTTQSILARLWTDHRIPFLVLDPAKSDYGQLLDALEGDELLHIRLTPADLAFNPFAVPDGVPVAAHAGRVLAAFDTAFSLSSVYPVGYITLARALYAAYDAAGTDGVPPLQTLYADLDALITRSGFTAGDGSNLRASLLGRVEFLSRGPLGRALTPGAEGAIDYARLLSRPTVIEMREFSGPMERSLVFALLVAGIISYREANPIAGGLGHVTVLEEAHRVLGGEGVGASEGVRLLVEAIAELRGSGEGFVIVDQAPTLLHPGVLKLSGSVLTHRLVDPEERIVIGSAVLLDERQQQDLARLTTGQVVLHSAERTSSVVVAVDPVANLLERRSDGSSRARHRLPWKTPATSGGARETMEQAVRRLADDGVVPGMLRSRMVVTLAARHGGDTEAFLADYQALEGALAKEYERRRTTR
ncbi:MAG: hypothetical protein Q7T71_07260 [Herbiconiux sp.]|nr:hypothetical protein [Herbiconiux sp.]